MKNNTMWLGKDTPDSQIGLSGAILCQSFGHAGPFFLRNPNVSGAHFIHPSIQQSLILCAGDFTCILGLN